MSKITAVEILKRADLPPHNVPIRFKSVVIRIGTTDHSNHGLEPIVVNQICGEYPGGNMEIVALIFCDNVMEGRFITMQSSAITYLEVDEANVLVLV